MKAVHEAANAQLLRRAHVLMRRALQQLDAAGAPGDIGAHLDLAICRLNETLASGEALVDRVQISVAAAPVEAR